VTVRLIAVGIWFQIWGAAEEKARRPKSVFAVLPRERAGETGYRGTQRTARLMVGYEGKQVVERRGPCRSGWRLILT